VQVEAGVIGPVLTALHETLDSWLGEPQTNQSEGRVTLNYRFASDPGKPSGCILAWRKTLHVAARLVGCHELEFWIEHEQGVLALAAREVILGIGLPVRQNVLERADLEE